LQNSFRTPETIGGCPNHHHHVWEIGGERERKQFPNFKPGLLANQNVAFGLFFAPKTKGKGTADLSISFVFYLFILFLSKC
jgi:hypothetical protein